LREAVAGWLAVGSRRLRSRGALGPMLDNTALRALAGAGAHPLARVILRGAKRSRRIHS